MPLPRIHMLIGQRSADTEFVRSRPLCSADEEKENAQSRLRGGSCTGIGSHCRGKGSQACKTKCGGIVGCSSSRLWYRPAASGPFPPQLLLSHRTGALERPLQLLRTARRRLVEAIPQHVYQPHSGSHAHAPQLSPSRCVHRCARHARTSCTRLRFGAGCFGGLCCADRALRVGRAAACLAGPAAVCLPLHPPRRMRMRTLDRPSTRLRLQSGDAELAENASDAESSAEEDDEVEWKVNPPPPPSPPLPSSPPP